MLSVDLDGDFLSQNCSIPRSFHRSLGMRSSSKRIRCSRVWKLFLWIQLNDNQLLIEQELFDCRFQLQIWMQLSPFGCQTSWHIDGMINSADKIKIHLACIMVSDGFLYHRNLIEISNRQHLHPKFIYFYICATFTQLRNCYLTTEFRSSRSIAYKRKMIFFRSCAITSWHNRLQAHWVRHR